MVLDDYRGVSYSGNISQYLSVSNQHIVLLKLIQCYVSVISQYKKIQGG